MVADGVCECAPVWSPDSTLLATRPPSSAEVLILSASGDLSPVRVPSSDGVGVLSWQAIR
jgi:hypothetical protein